MTLCVSTTWLSVARAGLEVRALRGRQLSPLEMCIPLVAGSTLLATMWASAAPLVLPWFIRLTPLFPVIRKPAGRSSACVLTRTLSFRILTVTNNSSVRHEHRSPLKLDRLLQ